MTAPTLPLIPQPDLEAFVWSAIRGIPGVTSFCYAATWDHIGYHVAYSVQVDARASTKQAASARAEDVRQTLFTLPTVTWAEGVITYVQPVEGPFWLPDDDGSPRYTARYEIRCHPF
jgi:hypothetical protein